ncbi:hypothetical protein JI721_07965 [Alicyclobacillus cycloheptanicus]|uniref:YbbR domain-containing protein n=1 Tax=Alicyclobacillus cycloheptanicus TaxID=1457 RepID=A0ABT9XJG3_9BACL|nr:CdaR family protein [Alicyclobacillus cycloheptanicus]MDQ0190447.1 YbbR domain-containing protein [Alicyclobacillus cycloheptanicus]WDM02686.1 hypothetical protein JI721_07965 [Alicyclobacillus cycloheptanicus]
MDRFLHNNTVLRIIALVLAFAVWLGVNASSSANGTGANIGIAQTFPKSIQVLAPANMVVVSQTPSTGAVVVRANPQDLASLPGEMLGVTLVADARGLTAGTHKVQVAALNMPALGSQSYTLQPSVITVTLAQKATRTVGVSIQTTGAPGATYTVGKPTADVTRATVSGAASAVNKVSQVTATVSVQNAKQTVTHIANLTAVDASGNPVPGVTVNPATATVTVPIQAPLQPVMLIPQVIGTPAAGYAVAGVKIQPSTIQASGTFANNGTEPTINIPVDVTGLQATRTLHLSVPLSQGVTQAQPSSVTATVTIEPSLSRTFSLPILVKQLTGQEKVQFTGTKQVQVTVAGPRSIVSGLTAGQLTAYIDASALTNQSHEATVQVLTPAWIQVAELSQNQVPVQVSGKPS